MTEKQKILKDPADNSPSELLDAVERGIITVEELFALSEDVYSKKDRADLRAKIEEKEFAAEVEHWDRIQSNLTEKSIRDFIAKFPDGQKLREARLKLEDICWEKLTQSHPSMDDIEKFLKEFRTGTHRKQAEAMLDGVKWDDSPAKKILRKKQEIDDDPFITDKKGEFLNFIVKQMKSKKIQSQHILDMLYYDHNAFDSFIIYGLHEAGLISLSDLENKAGIDPEFIKFMKNNPPTSADAKVKLPEPNGDLTNIQDGFTEFYFWGIPSSGKTCALAGVLSAANSGRVCQDFSPMTNSQGFDYMSTLSEYFKKGKVVRLPGSTSVTDTYEMKFDIEGRYEKKSNNGSVKFDHKYYRCAAIDLAGELFCCIHQDLAGKELKENQQKALANLKNILVENKSKNRKIHFFVIEYGAENRSYKGHTQDVYLRSCMRYIEEQGIFDKTTDRIYIMVTKSDKFDVTKTNSESDILRQYISENYLGFYKNLKNLCQKYDINDGEPGLIAYNIGDVCFQDYCRFHPGKSESIVYSCFLDTVYGHDRGWVGKLKKTLGL